mmetsp:Transcript_14040/g.61147  ORF Transcript_14040/g.61147 Transcript_14040/m.61147 type:complete len:230 (-) Transcript_14040:2089-2778(-)
MVSFPTRPVPSEQPKSWTPTFLSDLVSVSHCLAAKSTTSSISPAVISLIAGREFATRQTSVPCLSNWRANGNIPRTKSAPLLSQNNKAFLYRGSHGITQLSHTSCLQHDAQSGFVSWNLFLKSSKQSTAQGRVIDDRAFRYISSIVPFLYKSTQLWLPQSKIFPARTPSIKANSRLLSSIPSSSANKSGRTASAAAFSFCFTSRYTSLNPKPRRHSSRISRSSDNPTRP